MGKFDKIIIVSDLDGTFFGATANVLESNTEKIEYFKSEGGHFTIATGRDYPAVKTLIPNVEDIVNAPAILSNGSFIYDFEKSEKLSERTVDLPIFKALMKEIMEKFPDVGIRIGMKDPSGFVCPNFTPLLEDELRAFKHCTYVIPLDEIKCDKWYKAVLIAMPDRIDEVRDFVWKSEYSKHFTTFKSSSILFEVLDINATKGKQLASVKEYCGGSDCICYGVGDYDNDVELLTMSDVAACPSNAVDKIKAISDIELCHHTQGAIADLIDKIDKKL